MKTLFALVSGAELRKHCQHQDEDSNLDSDNMYHYDSDKKNILEDTE